MKGYEIRLGVYCILGKLATGLKLIRVVAASMAHRAGPGDGGSVPAESKMGQRDVRRLLITGATAVVRHASRRGEITDPWLAGMLARKPKKVVAVALANKMARTVWALATRGEAYRVRAAA